MNRRPSIAALRGFADGLRSPAAQARLFGLLVMASGVAAIASAMFAPWRERLRLTPALNVIIGSRLASGTTFIIGVALLVVGRGVARRRRLAYRATVVLLLAATVIEISRGPHIIGAAASAVLAAILIWRRRLFVVPVPQARLGGLIRLVAAVLALDFTYGLILLIVWRDAVPGSLTPTLAASEVMTQLLGLPGPLVLTGHFGQWFEVSLIALGATSLAVVLLAALAPVPVRGGGSPGERDEARRIIDRGDGDTLDPFILRRDKQWIFSARRNAVLGCRYVGGVGLASGDPAGDPNEFPDAVKALLDMCERYGWRPAFVGARADRLDYYRQPGLHTVYIGDEAIIDVRGFNLEGRHMRNVRQAVNRSIRAGVRTRFLRERDLDSPLRNALLDVAATQRADNREFGFSMALGDLLNGAFPDCLVIVATDAEGAPIAFQRYVPCRHGAALSLDVMRRLPNSPNGVNEHLIVEVVGWAAEHGVDEVSLNFAAFRALLDPDGPRSRAQAAEAFLVARMEGRLGIQLDSLGRFNAKFHPRWVPRYLAYRSRADLPAIGLAALSSEGFLPFDRYREP